MSSVSFLAKLVSKGSVPIYFIRCEDMIGRECFHYLISTPEKMRMYEHARKGELDIADYGQVIASGFGKAPTASIRQMLKDTYGLDA